MSLQRDILLIPLLYVLFSLYISCYFCFQEDPPLHNYIEEITSGYGSQAYPSYYSTIEDGEFKDLIKLRTGALSLKKFEKFDDVHKSPPARVNIFNVDDFGAEGDGTTDDTEAFRRAWKLVCSSSKEAILVVSDSKSYNLKPIWFSGPCKSKIRVQIEGNIEASDDRSDYKSRHWLVFDSVQDLTVEGGGTINGNGNIWWQNSCKINKSLPCKGAPTALTFNKCKNLITRNLKIKDAQQVHVTFDDCENVEAFNLSVTAPDESPNTDGIHVTNTQNIQITSSVIGTGDDCISIVNGSQKVEATDITCGPGHGISIGSLGSRNSKAYVSEVTVDGAKFSGTQNGVRIKTWQGGSGTANNIIFKNIEMHGVKNPIIIDQNYCDQDKPCKKQKSAVQVRNVLYQNITGTSASEVAIKFDCSESHPCEDIALQNIDLKLARGRDDTAKAICNNVNLIAKENVSPQCP